jgi:hypothetical protein
LVTTAHIKQSDAEILDDGAKLVGFLYANEYGFGFHADIESANWLKLGLSRGFFDNAQQIFAAGFDRVEFDQDAETVEGLATFDW